ncbi:hypothetical protein D3C71_1362020 [compost metagenome]
MHRSRQAGNGRGDLVGLDTALAFLVVGVEVVLPVVADLALAVEQQHRQQASPVRVGAVGQLAQANAQLTGFVAAQLFDQDFDRRFKVQVLDFEFSTVETLGMTAADPFAQGWHHADPWIGFFGLVGVEQVGHCIDPGIADILFEQLVKRTDHGTTGQYFSTHG